MRPQESNEYDREVKRLKNRISKLSSSEAKFRKENQNIINENRELKRMINAFSDLYFWLDKDMKILDYIAKRKGDLYIGPEKFLGKKVTSVLPSNITKKINMAFNKVKNGKKEETFEYSIIMNNRERFFEARLINYSNKILAAVRDITSLKDTLKAYKEAETEKEVILESIEDYVIYLNNKYEIIWGNKAFAGMVGIKLEQIKGQKCCNILFKKTKPCTHCPITKTIKTNKAQVEEIKTKDNKYLLLKSYPVVNINGNLKGIVLIISDITDKIIAEKILKESEKQFKILAENSPNMIFIINKEHIDYINNKCIKTLGYSRKEMSSSKFKFFSLFDMEHRILAIMNFQKHLTGMDVEPFECRVITKSGKPVDIIIATKLITFKGRQSILGVATDVSNIKKAEKKIRERETLYRTLVETSPDSITMTDINGKIQMINKKGLEIYGFKKMEEAKGLNVFNFIALHDRKRALNNVKKAIKDGVIKNIEYDFLRKNGSKIPVELSASVIYDEDNNPKSIIAFIRDISERKKLEEEVLMVQKLESLGIISTGFAHDFNNLLTTIMGNISLLKNSLKKSNVNYEILNDAETASRKAKELTKQLITFSKEDEPVKKMILINDVIETHAKFIYTGSKIKYKIIYPQNDLYINVDPVKIGQVINNIFINAKEAMKSSGTVRIKVENVSVKKDDIFQLKRGIYVKISISDSGKGIRKIDLTKIFDPYYSTKTNGSGLGLSIAYSVISKHGGYIYVDSEYNKGTTVIVYLPIYKKEKKVISIKSKRVLKSKKLILLMDDQEFVRKTAKNLLNNLDCNVHLAKDGKEALSIFKRSKISGKKYDLVILDLTVPGKSGAIEVINDFLEMDKNVRVFVSSGHTNVKPIISYKEYGFSGVLYKPYTLNELRTIITQ